MVLFPSLLQRRREEEFVGFARTPFLDYLDFKILFKLIEGQEVVIVCPYSTEYLG